VIHIGEGYFAGFHALFATTPADVTRAVSAHYVVYRNGRIEQWVREEDAAYHAGVVNNPTWPLLEPWTPNRQLIGIEHEGFTGEPWTEAMYQADAWLCARACKRWGIVPGLNTIIGHWEIDSVNRLRCPGNGVDLHRIIAMTKELLL